MSDQRIGDTTLVAYIDGELDATQRAELETLLENDEELHAQLEGLLALHQNLQNYYDFSSELSTPKERVWNRLLHQIEAMSDDTMAPNAQPGDALSHLSPAARDRFNLETQMGLATVPSAAKQEMEANTLQDENVPSYHAHKHWRITLPAFLRIDIGVPIGIAWGGVCVVLGYRLLKDLSSTTIDQLRLGTLLLVMGLILLAMFVVTLQSRFAIAFNSLSMKKQSSEAAGVLALLPSSPIVRRVSSARKISSFPWTTPLGSPKRTVRRNARLSRVKHRGLRWLSAFIAVPVLTLGLKAPIVISIDNPPSVPDAAAIKQQYEGQTISYTGDSVGLGHRIDQALANQFEHDTGIKIDVQAKPQSATATYDNYQSQFQAQKQGVKTGSDVYFLDIIYFGAFSDDLLDLKEKFGVSNRLVAVSWFQDVGLLYYRTDLLKKYGYSRPPETWDELEQMAKRIQDGERDGKNNNFWGWVIQGAPYEGLTVNTTELLVSQGGGSILTDGRVTINNANAIRALNRARGWIGTISSPEVLSYKEEEARNAFESGNAAFMRNWPYAYTLLNDQANSAVAGKFDVAPLPHDPGQPRVGTLGGQQLGVSKYLGANDPKRQGAAIEFVYYLTSPEVQKWRAQVGSYVPASKEIQEDWQVRQKLPFLEQLGHIQPIERPSTAAGAHYNEVSTRIFQCVSQILRGADAAQIVPGMEQDIQHVLSSSNSKEVKPSNTPPPLPNCSPS
jgi:trehalose/maltose transport system substrate-binding protein